MSLHKQMLTNLLKVSPVWRKRLLWGTALFLGGIVYLKVVIPVFHLRIPCVFSVITGLDCAGCGLTRAVFALLDFNIYQAFRYNMLVFILAPLYLMYLLLRKRGYKRSSTVLMSVMLVSALVFGVLRNVPMFSWLAPTVV